MNLDKRVDINNRFTYHKPFGTQPERYESLRGRARELALAILELCPESREQSLALTKLEEAIFWANAGIARNEPPPFCAGPCEMGSANALPTMGSSEEKSNA